MSVKELMIKEIEQAPDFLLQEVPSSKICPCLYTLIVSIGFLRKLLPAALLDLPLLAER